MKKDEPASPDSSLALADLERINAICVDFESNFKQGSAPRIEDQLGDTEGAVRDRLLTELLLLEVDYRLRQGSSVLASDYRDRFPEDIDLVTRVVADSIAAESEADGVGVLPSDPKTGRLSRTLGDYRIIREVGRGGMGVVYEAEQISLGRRVALKVLPFAAVLDSRQLQRFRTEAQAAALLHHQNIVPVYSVGNERGVHYYAMQFIDGFSLSQMIEQLKQIEVAATVVDNANGETAVRQRDGNAVEDVARSLTSGRFVDGDRGFDRYDATVSVVPHAEPGALRSRVTAGSTASDTKVASIAGLSSEGSIRHRSYFKTVANLGIEAALALEHAHDLGVVHRDIKPSNLMVDPRGKIWVTDFGLARVGTEGGGTVTGDLLGTFRYMSPEQAMAKRIVIDHRTDIYSLGATLYELLTLTPAKTGKDREELLRQIAFDEPLAPQRLNKALPLELATIVLKAMAKNPEERYATAQELADDLRRFLDDKPILARRPTLVQRASKWTRRHSAFATTAAIALLLLLIVVAVGGALMARRERQVAEKERSSRLAVEALVDAAQELATEKSALAASEQTARVEKTQQLWTSLIHQARALRLGGQIGHRTLGWKALEQAASLIPVDELSPEDVLELRNEMIASMGLVDLQPETEFDCYPAGQDLAGIDFDAELEHFARFDDDGNLSFRRARDNQEISRITHEIVGRPEVIQPGWRMNLRLSPNGKYVAASGLDDPNNPIPTRVWNLNGPTLVHESKTGLPWFSHATDFDDRSQTFAVANKKGEIIHHDLPSGQVLAKVQLGASTPGVVRFQPRGDRVAVAQGTEVHVIQWNSDQKLTRNFPEHANMIAWSSDGQRIAVAANDNLIYVWHPFETQAELVCRGHRAAVLNVAFNDQGNLLASTGYDGTSRIWDSRTGRQLLQTSGYCTDFSKDDRFLGFGWSRSTVGRWKVTHPTGVKLLTRIPRCENVSISGDGRVLLCAGMGEVQLWDTVDSRLLGALDLGPGYCSATLAPSAEFLVTCSQQGLYRWPIVKHVNRSKHVWSIGSPEDLLLPLVSSPKTCSITSDSRYLTVFCEQGGSQLLVLDLEESPRQARRIGVGPGDTSSDGQWTATAPWQEHHTKIWNAKTGELVRQIPGMNAQTTFSPDKSILVVARAEEVEVYDSSWKLIDQMQRESGGGHRPAVAFSGDGKLMAYAHSSWEVRLLDATNRTQLATLAAPHSDMVIRVAINEDGSQLVACTRAGDILHWDLRRIRQELRAFKLDWNSVGPNEDAGDHTVPLHLEVENAALPNSDAWNRMSREARLEACDRVIQIYPDYAEAYGQRGSVFEQARQFEKADRDYLEYYSRKIADDPTVTRYWQDRSIVHYRLKQLEAALGDATKLIELAPDNARHHSWRKKLYCCIEDYSKAVEDAKMVVELMPEDAKANDSLAWLYVTSPPEVRNPQAALQLAKKAVQISPDSFQFRTTLGAAHYRMKQYEQAIKELVEGLELPDATPTAFHQFFLAMSYQADRQPEQVASCLLNAVTWWAKQRGLDADSVRTLERMRAEVQMVIPSATPNPGHAEQDKEADKKPDKKSGVASPVPVSQ